MALFCSFLSKQWRKAIVIGCCLYILCTCCQACNTWRQVQGHPSSQMLEWQGAGVRTVGVPGTNWHSGETQTHSHTTGAGASEPQCRSRSWLLRRTERVGARAEVIKRTLYGAITDIMTWDTLPALPPPNWEHRQQIKIESNCYKK